MFLVGALQWWYSAGWIERARRIRARLATVADMFSFAVIGRTLFSPFRQISAGPTGNSVADQMRGFFDKSFSRVIGAILRLFVLLAGVIVSACTVVLGVVELIIWPLMPLLPIIGIVLFSIGVTI